MRIAHDIIARDQKNDGLEIAADLTELKPGSQSPGSQRPGS